MANGGNGRAAGIEHLAAFRMEQPFEHQFTGKVDFTSGWMRSRMYASHADH